MNVGIIILAAGTSERLGHPKQLIPFHNQTLLDHAIVTAMQVSKSTFVVLGANTGQILPALKPSGVIVVQNSNWQEGMSSSIRIGLQALTDIYPKTDAVILMVCDQPFINPALLNNLINTAVESGKGIVASYYNGLAATPALFVKNYFDDLVNITGDTGARNLFDRYASDLTTIPFEKGEIDIDTEMDLGNLNID